MVLCCAGVWERLSAMNTFCVEERRELPRISIRGLTVPHSLAPLFPELDSHV